jgi:hypothetical protein
MSVVADAEPTIVHIVCAVEGGFCGELRHQEVEVSDQVAALQPPDLQPDT